MREKISRIVLAVSLCFSILIGFDALGAKAATTGTLIEKSGSLYWEESVTYSFTLDSTSNVKLIFSDETYGDAHVSIKDEKKGTEVYSEDLYISFYEESYDVRLEPGNYSLTLSTDDYSDFDYELKVTYSRVIDINHPYYSISEASKTIYTGKKAKLAVKVQPTNATIPTVVWSSDNNQIATVSSTGEITAVKKGTTYIRARFGGKTLSCKVTVNDPVYKISKTSVVLHMPQTYQLKVTVSPASYGVNGVKWTSSNNAVATVSSTGVVTAKKKGTTTITAAIGVHKVMCKVTVRNMELNVNSSKVYVKKTTKLSVLGGTGKITWKTNNKKVATVTSGGVVKGITPGKVVISATRNGKTVKCTVKVTYMPETGQVISSRIASNNGGNSTKKIQLSGKCTITISAYSGGSSDEYDDLYVVLEDKDNDELWSEFIDAGQSTTKTITLQAGTYYIYYDADDEFNITVKGTVKPQLNYTNLKVAKGYSRSLKTVAVKNSVKWTSSNKKIATVNSKGEVRGKKNGTCTITCTLKNGKKLVAKVKVVNPVTASVTSVSEEYIYNHCYFKVSNNTNKRITYITFKIAQYDNRGKKLRSPYDYYYINENIYPYSNDSGYYWVNEDAKKCKISIVKVWFSDGSTWKP